ncbi:lysozyme inhibitor LprI family protein, partial [Burkholderia thailandensis]|uniref:lysozyme inhibitor LprI family protein n=1 Tax=Burkholderia thailandensis TaxID=57975 RepID=UPI00217E9A10
RPSGLYLRPRHPPRPRPGHTHGHGPSPRTRHHPHIRCAPHDGSRNGLLEAPQGGSMATNTQRLMAAALGAALAFGAPFARAASFDCARAASAAERAICGTPALGELDVRMAAYYELLQNARPADEGIAYREFRDALRDGQQSWRQRVRDACGARIDCLTNAYTARIAALRGVAAERLALRMTGGSAPSPDAAGATYAIEGESIKLTNGESVRPAAPGSAAKRVTTLVARSAPATIAGGPLEAVLLSDDPGGSGRFLYVATVQPGGGAPAVLLGDRVKPVSVSIERAATGGAIVVVEYLDRPEGAPFAQAPTVKVVRRFALEQGRLVEQRG